MVPVELHMMGCIDEDEKDILIDLSALFEEDIHQWKRQIFGDAEDRQVPHETAFSSQNMFSRGEILGAVSYTHLTLPTICSV